LPHRRPGRPSAVAPQHDGISPPRQSSATAAERAIRPGVLWRQGSVGTQTPAGSHAVDALMTVVATPKQPHHLLADVTAAGAAELRGEPAPSLRPTREAVTHVRRPAASLGTPR
jgi:hypothetical protein